MNNEVLVRSFIDIAPVKVRALMANCSPLTQLSSRLAAKLNLNRVREVYFRDAFMTGPQPILKGNVSLQPISIFNNDTLRDQDLCLIRIIWVITLDM